LKSPHIIRKTTHTQDNTTTSQRQSHFPSLFPDSCSRSFIMVAITKDDMKKMADQALYYLHNDNIEGVKSILEMISAGKRNKKGTGVQKPKENRKPKPYNIFTSKQISILKETEPGLSSSERLTKACSMWKTLSKEEKESYAVTPSTSDAEEKQAPDVENKKKPSNASKATGETKGNAKESQVKKKSADKKDVEAAPIAKSDKKEGKKEKKEDKVEKAEKKTTKPSKNKKAAEPEPNPEPELEDTDVEDEPAAVEAKKPAKIKVQKIQDSDDEPAEESESDYEDDDIVDAPVNKKDSNAKKNADSDIDDDMTDDGNM